MHYCEIHERVIQPAGYDVVETRTRQPAHWRPLPRRQVAWALAMAGAWHCTTQIAVEIVPCDRCEEMRWRTTV